MDDIAQDSGLTQVDRAERARAAFRMYSEAYPDSMICDLIADLLHLANVDRPEGEDAETALDTAVDMYRAEGPDDS